MNVRSQKCGSPGSRRSGGAPWRWPLIGVGSGPVRPSPGYMRYIYISLIPLWQSITAMYMC